MGIYQNKPLPVSQSNLYVRNVYIVTLENGRNVKFIRIRESMYRENDVKRKKKKKKEKEQYSREKSSFLSA